LAEPEALVAEEAEVAAGKFLLTNKIIDDNVIFVEKTARLLVASTF
jgi:hypothetical protein